MTLFLLNVLMAVVWFGLSSGRSLMDFVIGLLLSFAALSAVSPLFPKERYVSRVVAFFEFGVYFIYIFLISNLTIAWAVLTRSRASIKPAIFSLDIRDLSQLETLILAQAITLTPGTTTIDVEPETGKLFVHAFDGADIPGVRRDIENNLKKAIIKMMRGTANE